MVDEQELDRRVLGKLNEAGLEPSLDTMEALGLRAEIGRQMEATAIAVAEHREAQDLRPSPRSAKPGGQRGAAYTLEHWQKVATEYREAKAVGLPAMQHLMAVFAAPMSRIGNWPRKCVELGLLEQSELSQFATPRPGARKPKAKAAKAKTPSRPSPAAQPPKRSADPGAVDMIVETVLELALDGRQIRLEDFGAIMSWRDATRALLERLGS